MASPSSSISVSCTCGGSGVYRSMEIISPKFNTSSTVVNRRASSSGTRYHPSMCCEDQNGNELSSGIENYIVQIPPTPESPSSCSYKTAGNHYYQQQQQMSVSNTIFTGGYNNVTTRHLMGNEVGSQNGCASSALICAMEGCDEKVMCDEKGDALSTCNCEFKICRDCYLDALKNGGQCYGCKEHYTVVNPEEGHHHALPPPPHAAESKVKRRLSFVKSINHSCWLYETKGSNGYGNAVFPRGGYAGEGTNRSVNFPGLGQQIWKPLSRKTSISAATLNPYRLLILIRFVGLGLFLTWRVCHPNEDAMMLWIMSVICEIWFAFSWLLDQLPKLYPVNRTTDLNILKVKFECPSLQNPRGESDLPGIDIFVSTADAEKESSMVTANTILSILAVDYPAEKINCYLSDDGGALLTFEALAEAASFARIWVPFCRKHSIEPRNPESYFNIKRNITKNKVRPDFVKDRRRIKREYDEFKVRINSLPDSIRRRSDASNAHEEIRSKRVQIESGVDPTEPLKVPKATWMVDGKHWPGMWTTADRDHSRGDHASIIQVMLTPPSSEPFIGNFEEGNLIDVTNVDIRLPMLVYVSREKRPGYDHNKKAGAMNALVRTSAIMSNGAFILNLDCDHYIYNSLALREAMCFVMDKGGDEICYVQFPQRFEGVDPSDRYANHNTVFFDVNMRALDGLQGPMYLGTGCVFRRFALYGFDPPRVREYGGWCKKHVNTPAPKRSELNLDASSLNGQGGEDEDIESQLLPKGFGNSTALSASIPIAEYEGRPLADNQGVKNGRLPGALTVPRKPLNHSTVTEAINVISCWYEDRTEWGQRIGWIYGSVTEDIVTGYRMHNRGWRSIYCVTTRDAFRGTAPINLTDRLHQVLRWATGSVEIFFSRNNALFASCRMKLLQRIAYINVAIYPFTSIFLMIYCFLPALSLFTGQFIVQTLDISFLVLLLIMTLSLCLLVILEIKWSGITLQEWWRNEQFWLIGGTSAHLTAVVQGLLKVIAGVDISFTLTSKSSAEDEGDEFADLYIVKWSCLMIPPITIIMINIIGVAVGIARTIYGETPQWSKLSGGVVFSSWVLCHLYPFVKGLMGRKGKTPAIVIVWSGLLAISTSLLWVSIASHQSSNSSRVRFDFP